MRISRTLAVFILSSSLLLGGCAGGTTVVSVVRESYDYPRAQAMLVVAAERSRYEEVYTDAVWDVTLEQGQTLEEYLLEQVKLFLKDLKTMNLLAESQEITINSAEKDRIRQVAEEYYSRLTQDDIDYTGATEEDVLAMYQDYYLANKVVGEMTKEVNLEVSDSEAKVISLRQIVLSDPESVEEVYGQVTAEGSDFAAIAKTVSESETIERQMGRGEEPEALEEAAFSLASGEISKVVQSGGLYYIFQCISDYDVEATQERKTQLYEERKNQVFQEIYTQFQSENKITFSDEMWADIHFSKEDHVTADYFFTLYHEEFGSEGY